MFEGQTCSLRKSFTNMFIIAPLHAKYLVNSLNVRTKTPQASAFRFNVRTDPHRDHSMSLYREYNG